MVNDLLIQTMLDVNFVLPGNIEHAFHLERHHKNEWLSFNKTSKSVSSEISPTSTSNTGNQLTIKNINPYPFNSLKTKAITRVISVFLAADLRPLSVVNRPAFRNMVH